MLAELAEVGRDPVRGGWSRHLLDDGDVQARAWFVATAERLGLRVDRDGNANLWASWDVPGGSPAILTGSHLDSVQGGGALDGPLGIVSAFAAVARLKAEGHVPAQPLIVVAFAEEEGARFGVPTLGSRLTTGAISPQVAAELRDRSGLALSEVFAANGLGAAPTGLDADRLAALGVFVELHVEQGTLLAPFGAPIGLAEGILAHGRWRVTVTGRADHAGTTELGERHDPMLPAAALIRAARDRSTEAAASGARATCGRIDVVPGATNAIPSRVQVWLDVRAESEAAVQAVLDAIIADGRAAAADEDCTCEVDRESFSPTVAFDPGLTDRIARALEPQFGPLPLIPTGAGHDAGVLAPHLPSAMLFVRNPTGVSHAPGEAAEPADIALGVDALTAVLRDLTS